MSTISNQTPCIGHLWALVAVAFTIGLLAGWPEGSHARGGKDDRLQAKVRECANRVRDRHGLPKLRNSKPLNQAASLHAHNMARRGFFDHVDPQGRDAGDRVAEFVSRKRYGSIGENIAAGQNGPRSACSAWRKSSGHKDNILRKNYSFVGGGFVRGGRYDTYYVQVFAE